MSDYISREAANEACREAIRRYPNSFYNGIEAARDAIRQLPAADAIEELIAYVRQIEELRKDGYYLQKTKMATCGQATMTMPLPEPPKEEGET